MPADIALRALVSMRMFNLQVTHLRRLRSSVNLCLAGDSFRSSLLDRL